jgi:penicillin-binding protein 1A
MFARWWLYPLFLVAAVVLAAMLLFGYAVAVAYPKLPSLEVLTDYQPKIPLRVYSAEGDLIGEFGEERRALVKIANVPKPMRDAILAAEDERFYEHGGIDYMGVARAVLSNFLQGGARQGASTITMQVARNFFLTSEKTFARKFNEALLAFKIEHNLTKDEILQLYLNQIYLGQRAYGFAAAAQTYFGKPLDRLSLAEMALLAGLPKAPSRYNPVVNFNRSKLRQQYVLRRMRELGMITAAQQEAAAKEKLVIQTQIQTFVTRADFLTEMVRQSVYERYREDAYAKGLRVYTTIHSREQDAAYAALRKGVLDYDRRHGYRGAENVFRLPAPGSEETVDDLLAEETESDDILPAVVLSADARLVKAHVKGIGPVEISGEGLKFAARMLSDKAPPARRIQPGALVRIQKDTAGAWAVVQLPRVESGFVAIDAQTGAVRALVGGFDFQRNKFNHVTQAWRQPGSTFKPFVYSAALEKGFTPATIINDAPLAFDATETGSVAWEPKNFDGTFEGPMRMRTALTKSKNLVSIRILQSIGPQYAQDYVSRFGFDPKMIPPYLTMALGAGSVTVLQMAGAYSVFANGGFLVQPYVIDRIEDARGTVLSRTKPVTVADGAPRAIDARNAFVMTSIMQDVIRAGTAAKARALGRSDLAGKTGTTNEQMDAWFAGYTPHLTAVVWVGFDAPRSLGSGETGAQAALPIWISFMDVALRESAEEPWSVPEGVMAATVNPDTGLRDGRSPNRFTDYFLQEYLPPEDDGTGKPGSPDELDNQVY